MRRQAKKKVAEFKKPAALDHRKEGEEWEDVDEHEKDVFDKDGYFDVMETEALISASDQRILEQFQTDSNKPARVSEGRSLADLIMGKLASGDFQDGNKMDKEDGEERGYGVEDMDPKVIATYKKLGVVMKTYRSGKLPKAFKVIPLVANWEELLFLTKPHDWSPNATEEATKIFASNLNHKMAQRFYSLVLLENVRNNIEKFKKLNCHLYQAIKKSIFKTGAFFRGFLLPLAEDCNSREAVIVGSILAKMSINNLDSAAAIMKLTHMDYEVGSGFFLKTLLAKKYALPTQVINALVSFFLKFADQGFDEDDLDDDDDD